MSVRVRCPIRCFRFGAQSGSHAPVSTPCPPNRTCGFPASGSPVGSCLSHNGAPVRSGPSRYRRLCVAPAPRSCTASPAVPLSDLPPSLFTPRRHRAAKPASPAPSLTPCDASGLSALSGGDRRQSHSRGPSPLRHLSTPEAPFLDGRYPASSVLRASPPPCRPSLPLAGSRSPRARHRQGFPCCYAFHLPCMPAPIPRRKPAGAFVALFPAGQRPSPYYRRVGFRAKRFEACSAFTRVPACMVAEPPIGGPSLQGASAHVVTSMNRPGRYQPGATVAGWGSHPQGKRALSTAHGKADITFREPDRVIGGLPLLSDPSLASCTIRLDEGPAPPQPAPPPAPPPGPRRASVPPGA